MSSLHLSLDGGHPHDQDNGTLPEGHLLQSNGDNSLDMKSPRDRPVLSLSRPSGEAPSDTDGSSQSTRDALRSDFASAPPTPGSGSISSFDFESNGSSGHLSAVSAQPSLYSLTESLRESAVRWEYGRVVNTHSDVYKLPADEDEAERLDRQHRLYNFVFGDYVPPFRDVLRNNDDQTRPKTCLDIGCGSGAWIFEVAAAFPDVKCTAVDLAPLPAVCPSLTERTPIPPNLRFEIDDVNLGLQHFAGDFDVVHVRHISSGIRDYYRIIDDAVLVLRPHGLADFTECDWRVYDIDKRPIIPTTSEIWGSFKPPEGWTGTGMARSGTSPVRRCAASSPSEPSPFVARFLTLATQAVRRRGGHVDAPALLHRWFLEHPAYEDVVYREAWIPIGDWYDNIDDKASSTLGLISKEEIERFRWMGKEMGADILEFLRTTRTLLLSTDVPEALIDSLADKASQELRECRSLLYVRAQNVYARKKERRQDTIAWFNA